MAEWIRSYLTETGVLDSLQEADEGRNPFVDDTGATCLFSNRLRTYVALSCYERITLQELTTDLTGFGARPIHWDGDLNVQGKIIKTSRNYWQLPPGNWIPPRGATGP